MAAVTYDPEGDVLYVELAHVKDPAGACQRPGN
jgi:hypothetical protein